MSYLYVFLTIILTVYGQLIIKWQVSKAGMMPVGLASKATFLCSLLINLWVLSAFLAAFLASVSWMAAMTKLQLSHAYPLTSSSFILVVLLSGLFFNETVTLPKIAGIILIISGIVVGTRG